MWAAGIIGGYVLGAIPFGWLIGRWVGGVDVRRQGSGNIGTSNVLRTVGPAAGVLVLVLDAGKGIAAVALAGALGSDSTLRLLAGAAAVAGHIWPAFLRFRGGRGIATTLGILIALAPGVALALAVIWAVVVAATRYISVASIVVSVLLPFFIYFTGGSIFFIGLTSLIAAFAIFQHRGNIKRLLAGTEYRYGQRLRAPGGGR